MGGKRGKRINRGEKEVEEGTEEKEGSERYWQVGGKREGGN